MHMSYNVLAGAIVLAIAAWWFLRDDDAEHFTAFYEMPRREPNQFVRNPLEYKR